MFCSLISFPWLLIVDSTWTADMISPRVCLSCAKVLQLLEKASEVIEGHLLLGCVLSRVAKGSPSECWEYDVRPVTKNHNRAQTRLNLLVSSKVVPLRSNLRIYPHHQHMVVSLINSALAQDPHHVRRIKQHITVPQLGWALLLVLTSCKSIKELVHGAAVLEEHRPQMVNLKGKI